MSGHDNVAVINQEDCKDKDTKSKVVEAAFEELRGNLLKEITTTTTKLLSTNCNTLEMIETKQKLLSYIESCVTLVKDLDKSKWRCKDKKSKDKESKDKLEKDKDCKEKDSKGKPGKDKDSKEKSEKNKDDKEKDTKDKSHKNKDDKEKDTKDKSPKKKDSKE